MKKRYIGSIELINNDTEDNMIETYNIDPAHLPTLDVEPTGYISLNIDMEAMNFTEKLYASKLDLGLVEAIGVDVPPIMKRLRVKELIQAIYLRGIIPRNHDWHVDNLAVSPEVAGYIFVGKRRNIGILVTDDELDLSPNNGIKAMSVTIASERIRMAIKSVREDSTSYTISIKPEVIFEPTIYKGKIPKKNEERNPNKVKTLYVYEFMFSSENKQGAEIIHIGPKI